MVVWSVVYVVLVGALTIKSYSHVDIISVRIVGNSECKYTIIMMMMMIIRVVWRSDVRMCHTS